MTFNEEFLLTDDVAKELFIKHASKQPIIDYHCHLDPKEIYENEKFDNLCEAWLKFDHYKWRLMRANGVDEKLITGDGNDFEKFYAWAETIEKAIANPLYAWSKLELKRYFNIDLELNTKNAKAIWEQANELLKKDEFRKREFVKSSNVKTICTTDDPIDSLEYHDKLNKEEDSFKVYPTFRADNALFLDSHDFLDWLTKLESVCKTKVSSYDIYLNCLKQRIIFFSNHGCKLSDHSVTEFDYIYASKEELNEILSKAINKEKLEMHEINKFSSQTLLELTKMYADENWTMQLHFQATRNNNSNALENIGINSGFDAINDACFTKSFQHLLDEANKENKLPKTIVYSLNPNDYAPLLSLIGAFQADYKTKIQLGSGWWYNDTRLGMREQLQQFANYSLLGNFVGMLTDSRSFLSYTRHEYFRRVLCELFAEWYKRGEVIQDIEVLGKAVEDISFNNASSFFEFD